MESGRAYSPPSGSLHGGVTVPIASLRMWHEALYRGRWDYSHGKSAAVSIMSEVNTSMELEVEDLIKGTLTDGTPAESVDRAALVEELAIKLFDQSVVNMRQATGLAGKVGRFLLVRSPKSFTWEDAQERTRQNYRTQAIIAFDHLKEANRST